MSIEDDPGGTVSVLLLAIALSVRNTTPQSTLPMLLRGLDVRLLAIRGTLDNWGLSDSDFEDLQRLDAQFREYLTDPRLSESDLH